METQGPTQLQRYEKRRKESDFPRPIPDDVEAPEKRDISDINLFIQQIVSPCCSWVNELVPHSESEGQAGDGDALVRMDRRVQSRSMRSPDIRIEKGQCG